MENNKLVLPISIILGCIILGRFYYASEANKQQSIEKQQQLDIQAKQAATQAATEQNSMIAAEKADCVQQAQAEAISVYKNSYPCT